MPGGDFPNRFLATIRGKTVKPRACIRAKGSAMTDTAAVPPPIAKSTTHAGFWSLTLGCIGVVYGDIGTSPLYALRETVIAAGGVDAVSRADIIGVLSLMIWSLIVIVTIKYVIILLSADNDGEGGILSLLALAGKAIKRPSGAILALGLIGAGLFYGDALITPAISVLSAVEGLKLATAAFEPYVVPITLGIIVALFMAQSRGTAAVAGWFGPITLVWMLVMAVGGIIHLGDDPGVFSAFNPINAVSFLARNGVIGFYALGAVFLTVTGAEALYADLGHFGRGPIRSAWLGLVLPSLTLNYMGQAAMLMARPETIESPFFLLYPEWALLPVVALATAATIIASQAVITGAYSITRQAIQLKLLPRIDIRHTSESQEGQIYLGRVNALLMIGVIALVLLFRTSGNLATAYGIAVTGTMVVTACLSFIVIWRGWKWPVWAAALLIAPFLLIDLIFMGANLMKILSGGYVPLLIALAIMLVMATWRRGSGVVVEKARRIEVPLDSLMKILDAKPPVSVPGTAVYLTADAENAPASLLHALKHFRVLHERNVLLTVQTANVPRVADEERVTMENINDRFMRVVLSYGFMEEPNVPKGLMLCRKLGWKFDIMSTTFFVSRRTLRPAAKGDMPRSRMKSMTVSSPWPVFRFVNTNGRSPRMRRASRSITSSEAPT